MFDVECSMFNLSTILSAVVVSSFKLLSAVALAKVDPVSISTNALTN